jgi:TonB family protein
VACLVVLSGDKAFVENLERLGAPREVRSVTQEAELARMLRDTTAGVALIDTDAVTRSPLDRLTARLKLQFPQLVLIVVGNQRDQSALADQVARGTVYRFLLKPTNSQRLKVSLDTAWLRHEDGEALIEHGQGPTDGAFTKAVPWLIAAGVLVVTVGGGFAVRKLMMPSAADSQAAAQAVPPENGLENLLARADAALAGGAYENAADLYRDAQRVAPGDPRVAEGLNRVVRRVLAAAQTQLLDRHLDRAQQLAKEAVALEPDNPQVGQLVAQISAAQDHAAPAPAAPQGPASGPAPRPPEARADTDGRAHARLEEHLRHAQELMAQGHLLEPAQDNARLVLRQAKELAPNDPKVRQLQRSLLDLVLAEARKAIAAGHGDDVDRYFAPAMELGARSEDISDLTQRARAASAHNDANDKLASLFNDRLQQGKILEPAADSAKFYLAQLQHSDPNGAATQIARMALGSRLLAEAQSAVRHQDVPSAKRWLGEARDAGVDATSLANVEAELQASQTPAAGPAKGQQVQLVLVRHPDPDYPSAARGRVSGTVVVQFTVHKDGTTGEFAIVDSQPVGVFEQAAIDAVRKWKYRPPIAKDGTATEVRSQLTMQFKP